MTQPTDDAVLDELLRHEIADAAYAFGSHTDQKGTIFQGYIVPNGFVERFLPRAKQAIIAHFAKKQELAELRARLDELSYISPATRRDKDGVLLGSVGGRIDELKNQA